MGVPLKSCDEYTEAAKFEQVSQALMYCEHNKAPAWGGVVVIHNTSVNRFVHELKYFNWNLPNRAFFVSQNCNIFA